MEKIQALITLHKDKLEELGLTPLVVDPQSRELAQAILLDGYTDGEPNGLAMSFAELLFNTPFLSWLEWKEDGTYMKSGWMGSNDLFIRSDTNNSDYHKINLCLLNSDEEKIKYLEDNTITND